MFFGSVGSFFDFTPLEGSFETGPPYTEEVMDKMADRLEVGPGATRCKPIRLAHMGLCDAATGRRALSRVRPAFFSNLGPPRGQ